MSAGHPLFLLMPLAETIRAQLVGREFAGFRRTEQGAPCIEVRTQSSNRRKAALRRANA